ncbi:tRNA pseudouridine synthase-like 1 isoform X1 [Ixodes scapularis]|uniref:tRNA pseudouridine synthase-like 1 isoform X1 n=2 Tax=Ixodes scapularis TaxID=6945 RepID=UPI001A9F1E52|nr:tRNA pseudouridine synthase-like 1 isoform X1 [Ixodes scapularis]
MSSRYLLKFSYLGTRYRGMQRQSSRPCLENWTVQGAIEGALRNLRPLSEPVLILASRTDTGVHASLSAGHVDLVPANTAQRYQPLQIFGVLNRHFARRDHDIVVREVLPVPSWFHARYLAKSRSYVYRVAVLRPHVLEQSTVLGTTIRHLLPLNEINSCCAVPPLDFSRVHEAMELLSGEHDFRTFKNVGRTKAEDEVNTVRNVLDFTLRPSQPASAVADPLYDNVDLWEFHIKSRSFLYRQVRRMVSVVLHVGMHPESLPLVRHMLENPHKDSWDNKVRIAPACGLYLTNIEYDPAHMDLDADPPEEVVSYLSKLRDFELVDDEDSDENIDEESVQESHDLEEHSSRSI